MQGRFEAFPVQPHEHYLTVLRYVERNPLRANIVKRSQDRQCCRLKPAARSGPDELLCDGPILKPAQWIRHVNGVETEAQLKALPSWRDLCLWFRIFQLLATSLMKSNSICSEW